MKIKFLKSILFFKDLFSVFKYGQVYFYDTNMLVSNSETDKRYKKFYPKSNNNYVSEKVRDESENLLKKDDYRSIFGKKLNIVLFESLRREYPDMCPLYYNYIILMNNPAIVNDENFIIESINKSILKGEELSSKAENLLKKQISQLRESHQEEIDEDYLLLKEANIKYQKKKRKSIKNKDKNYFNDIKTIAISLLFCLKKKNNVTLITADIDFLAHVFDLFSAIAQQVNLKNKILETFNQEDLESLHSGKNQAIYVNSNQFTDDTQNFIYSFFNKRNKNNYLIFKIKYWDMKIQKYKTFSFRIDRYVRDLFLNSHGNLHCPCSKNNTMGNWIMSIFWWPPTSIHDKDTLKIMASAKNSIIKNNTKVFADEHLLVCRYPKEDLSNNLDFFSDFK